CRVARNSLWPPRSPADSVGRRPAATPGYLADSHHLRPNGRAPSNRNPAGASPGMDGLWGAATRTEQSAKREDGEAPVSGGPARLTAGRGPGPPGKARRPGPALPGGVRRRAAGQPSAPGFRPAAPALAEVVQLLALLLREHLAHRLALVRVQFPELR